MPHGDKLRIILIDDDPITLEMMTAMLENAGHEVHAEFAASFALPQIVRKRPDCVLVDLMMPELDGFDLCSEVRSHPSLDQTVLVVVTALDNEYWAGRAKEVGAAALITKPVDADAISKIEDVVFEARGGNN